MISTDTNRQEPISIQKADWIVAEGPEMQRTTDPLECLESVLKQIR